MRFPRIRTLLLAAILTSAVPEALAQLVGSGNVRTVYDNQCEVTQPDGTIAYAACAGEALRVLRTSNANSFNVTVDPPDYTCGPQPNQYCTEFRATLDCEHYCTSTPGGADSHPVEYVYDQNAEGNPNTATHWQSITWHQYPTPLEINITFSFGKLYELQSDIVLTFSTARPQRMEIQVSRDEGQTWDVIAYYDTDCKPLWQSGQAVAVVTTANNVAVTCTEEYSGEQPYTGGVVQFDLVRDRIQLYTGASYTNFAELYRALQETQLSNFLQFTDLRIALLYPATDGNEFSKYLPDLYGYYYGISNIDVTAGCMCNLHAKVCSNVGGRTVCDCKHNTEGDNCERCKPLYNNRPWFAGSYMPYPVGTPNPCLACQCNNHAPSCAFQSFKGYGVCSNCTHNTMGDFCSECITGFYTNTSVPINDINTCIDCACEPLGVDNNNLDCTASGNCFCKVNVQGRSCSECTDGFFGLLLPESPGICQDCLCDTDGTVLQSSVCEKLFGQCPCKPNIEGRTCNQCKNGFHSFPTGLPFRDCFGCGCDPGGSSSISCDKTTQQCTCQPNIVGQHCNSPAASFFVPSLDANQYQPVSGTCTVGTAMHSAAWPFTGISFRQCAAGQTVIFAEIMGAQYQRDVSWRFFPTIRYSLNGTVPWTSATLTLAVTGDSNVNIAKYQLNSSVVLGSACPLLPASADEQMNYLPGGAGQAWMSPGSITLDARCRYSATLTVGGGGNASAPLTIDSLVLMPDQNYSTVFSTADPALQEVYTSCQDRIAALITRDQALLDPQCQTFAFATMAGLAVGAVECACNQNYAVVGDTCAGNGGQCQCKPGIGGRICDQCLPGYFNLTVSGCEPCNCAALGSTSLVCDYVTGQCPCLPNVALRGEANVLGLVDDRQCRSCITDYYGMNTGAGCQVCGCSPLGSDVTMCNDYGNCQCKPTFNGLQCNQCESGYFSFQLPQCTLCNCSADGSVGRDCNAFSGQCNCKNNVMGLKCDMCAADSFNLEPTNAEGCQKCFCYGHSTQCSSAAGYTPLVISSPSVQSWLPADQQVASTATHVKAPPQYLGNRVSSYGTALTMGAKSRGPTVQFTSGQPVVLEGQGKTIFYRSNVTVNPTDYQPLSIMLQESYWYYGDLTQPDTFNFYAILADLTALCVQRIYNGNVIDLVNVALQSTQPASPGQPMDTGVENCTCANLGRNTGGLSCQDCAQGFQRVSGAAGNSYNVCSACDCSSNAETTPPMCDAITGECLNCRNGTNGTQCDGCSANVAQPACTACVDHYWGMQRDGCRACNCDPAGTAPSTVCDKTTGQCTCKTFVTGLQCERCQDNYFGLTAPGGCVVCPECYNLVMVEVEKLRAIQANLSSLVYDQLVPQDLNAVLGPFTRRLSTTTNNMQSLINFLNRADQVAGTVTQECQGLNSTLVALQGLLSMSFPSLLLSAAGSFAAAENNAESAMYINNDTRTTTKAAYDVYQGTLLQYSARVDALLAAVQQVERSLRDESNTALGDLLRVGQQVDNIDANSNLTLENAQQSLNAAQNAEVWQRDTLVRLNLLEQFFSLVATQGNQVSSSALYAAGNATVVRDLAIAAKNNVTNMPPITVDIPGISARASRMMVDADGLNTQAGSAVVTNQTIVATVSSTTPQTQAVNAQVAQLMSQSQLFFEQVSAATQEARGAQVLEIDTFNNATNMLQMMQNFDAIAQGVQTEASESLAKVNTIKQQSTVAIATATELRTRLQGTQASALSSSAVAGQALTITQANQQALNPVIMRAAQLQVITGSSLNDINSRLAAISALNASKISPARQVCDSVTAQSAGLEALTSQAEIKAKNVSAKTSQETGRVDQILQKFSLIVDVNQAAVDELRRSLALKQTEFNQPLMAGAVQRLTDQYAEQEVWLSNMKLRRTQLQAQVQRLRLIYSQLRP